MDLSKPDRAEYEFHHGIIQAGKATWLEVGTSLMVMRDKRLYLIEYESFEAYCTEEVGISGRRARQLMDAAAVVAQVECEIGEVAGNVVPTEIPSERVVRELGKAPAGTRKAVLEEAKAESNGKPTAKAVQKVIAKRKQESQPAPDAPPWAEFVETIEGIISRARTLANDLAAILECDAKTKKPAAKWAFYLPYDSTVGQLRSVIRNLEQHVPAAPFPRVQGTFVFAPAPGKPNPRRLLVLRHTSNTAIRCHDKRRNQRKGEENETRKLR